jgi:hypothetical protein
VQECCSCWQVTCAPATTLCGMMANVTMSESDGRRKPLFTATRGPRQDANVVVEMLGPNTLAAQLLLRNGGHAICTHARRTVSRLQHDATISNRGVIQCEGSVWGAICRISVCTAAAVTVRHLQTGVF